MWCNNDDLLNLLHEIIVITYAWLLTQLIPRYCQTSNIRHNKSQNLNVSHLVLQLSLPNPLQPSVQLRMKM